jgi:hypothetical protein
MTPTQIGKAGKERIGHKIPLQTALPAEVYENIPMPLGQD